MKFLNQRGYLSPNLRRATGGGAFADAGAVLIGGAYTGAAFARSGHSNAPGGVAGIFPSQTRIQLGSNSTQVALSSGRGATVSWAGSAASLGVGARG